MYVCMYVCIYICIYGTPPYEFDTATITTIHLQTLYTTLGQLQKIAQHPIRQYVCVYIYVDICIYICMLGQQTSRFTTTTATTINLTKWNRNTHVYT